MSGVANMAAGITSIARMRATIAQMPLRIRAAVVKDAEGALNTMLRADFKAGRTVYETPRPKGVHGDTLTLHKTGKAESSLSFVAVGTILRASLGVKYGKYLIGKYKTLPINRIPAKWQELLQKLVAEYGEALAKEGGAS